MKIPPTWMIEELKRRRDEREEQQRPQLWIDMPEPAPRSGPEPEPESARGPVVIELW
jgi:hypothetical protein